MPLLRARVADGYVLLLSEPSRSHIDIQLPIEVHAYSADRAKPAYEALIEPTVIGFRMKAKETSLPGLQKFDQTKMWIGAHALRAMVTMELASQLTRCILSLTNFIDSELLDDVRRAQPLLLRNRSPVHAPVGSPD